MPERLFISQSKLEGWVEQGKVIFEDNLLTLLSEKVSYRLEPAVRVTKVLDGQDRVGLVGKAVTVTELQAKKAECYHDSVLLGDTAYECEEGFIGTAQRAPAPQPVPVPEAVVEKPEAAPDNSADLLADFMLKHM